MKEKNELHKAELTTEELQLLVRHYEDAEDELAKSKSTLLLALADECKARKEQLCRMFDGRWTNRGKGRKPKPATDPGPELPMPPCAGPPPELCPPAPAEKPY